jgi:hypothetical protein
MSTLLQSPRRHARRPILEIPWSADTILRYACGSAQGKKIMTIEAVGQTPTGAQVFSRMLKKSASGVLASLRDSTYRSVRLASSLAAALRDSPFERPETIVRLAP